MSWDKLRKSFAPFKNYVSPKDRRKLLKRRKTKQYNENVKISDDHRTSFRSKKNKLDIVKRKSLAEKEFSTSDEEIFDSDPNLSDSCDCFVQKSYYQPLPLYKEENQSISPCITKYDLTNRKRKLSFLKNCEKENQNIYSKESQTENEVALNTTSNVSPLKSNNSPQKPIRNITPKNVLFGKCNKETVPQKLSHQVGDADLYQPELSTQSYVENNRKWHSLKNTFNDDLDYNIIDPDSEESTIKHQNSNYSNKTSQSGLVANNNTEQQKKQPNEINTELNSLIKEIQKDLATPQKKLSAIKGGLLERFRKVLRRYESDQVFWEHEGPIGLREKGVDAVVQKVEKSFGRNIVTLKVNGKSVKMLPLNDRMMKYFPVGADIETNLESNFYRIKDDIFYLTTNKFAKKY